MKKVVKFGGSSLANAAQFEKVRDIIREDESRTYVVCSAPGKRFKGDNKVTDLLLMCYQLYSHDISYEEVFIQIQERFTEINEDLGLGVALDYIFGEIKSQLDKGASKDFLVSRGEYLNGILLAKYLDYDFFDAADLISFDSKGNLLEAETRENIEKLIGKDEKAVIPGFYGSDPDGNIATFSRGGSDVTGSIIADGTGSDLYENWTDVPGFLVADPNLVPGAMPMERVSHKELRELSYMGAPVIHEEALFPLKDKGIKVQIKNTNNPEDPGTLIINEEPSLVNKGKITGIAGKKGFTVINIEKNLMNYEKGFLRKVISVFEANEISIEHIPSSVDSISVIVSDEELSGKEDKVMNELKIYCLPDQVAIRSGYALLTVVGHGMASVPGLSGKIFTALAKDDININIISQGASEISIIMGIEEKDFYNAVRSIYKAFNG